jgi:hypothetical protein
MIFPIDNLNTEALEAVNSRAALSATFTELISVLGDVKLELKLSNCYNYVNFQVVSGVFF